MIKLNPLTRKKLKRFRTIRRGYYSFLILAVMILLSVFAELLINSRALMVRYEGNYYFPTYGEIIPGTTFGLDYDYETNYRKLAEIFHSKGDHDNFVILPPVPYNPYENDLKNNAFPPFKPSFKDRHYLGTDKTGRDIVARLVYGFRIAIFFSIILLFATYIVGVSIGCLMGYLGGFFDLFFQRIIEIWTNIPYLYAIIIVSSILVPSFFSLLGIMIFFGWISMTWYMRTATYKEKSREYVLAARALGATNSRIIFRHILPNTVSIIITFLPFSIAGAITALTALDYLGFGLPPPTPSWGELLSQAHIHTEAWYLILYPFVALFVVILLGVFIGEGMRSAFDPKSMIRLE
jgi:microcin C transport system permease protein